MGRYELTDEIRAAFPDEREALRGLCHAVDTLIKDLKLGDQIITKEKKHWWSRQPKNDSLGWKNELSVSAVLDIEGKWLPLACERLGLK